MNFWDEILNSDTQDEVSAAYDVVMRKCDYGFEMEKLNAAERVLYIVRACEDEVNNGGFAQFFFNSTGSLTPDLVEAFRTIGAEKTAEICRRAVDVWGTELPTDTEARRDMLIDLSSEEVEQILNECDDHFYEGEEDLTELLRVFLEENRESFSE